MKDLVTDPKTSARMAGVRQRDTKIEVIVGNLLRLSGLRYRKNVKSLPGSPDFANKKKRWAVFVNGCYWHHHTGCRKATVPKRNTEFWINKFRANRQRDARAIRSLREMGFKVLLVWECQKDVESLALNEILETRRVDRG